MPTASSLLEAFGNNFPGLTQLLTMLAYGIGMWAGVSAVGLLQRRQRFDGSVTWGGIVLRAALCATGLYLPTAVSSAQETLFASPTILSYSVGSAVSESGRIVLDVVIRFVQLVGLWAFLWGWVLLNRAHGRGPYDPGLGHKALAHLVGGIFCMNIVATVQGVAQSFGLEALLNYVLVTGG
jgi:hypothetical protein